jgi:hypothetical protein
MRRALLAAALLLACSPACSKGGDTPQGPPPRATAPEPLPTLAAPPPPEDGGAGGDRDEIHKVAPAPVYGEKPPSEALRLELSGTRVKAGGQPFDLEKADGAAALSGLVGGGKRVLLVPDADTYVAQAAALFALLDDARAEPWLLHPSGEVAYRLYLSDEPTFQQWLEEPRPGKIRVIQRADGYELSTNLGKLLGADPNGPSVPLRGGQLDLAMLRRGLGLLKGRFKTAEDACLMPSFGTELTKVAASLSSFYRAPEEPYFEELCLVYPRPVQKGGRPDGGR